MNRLATDRASSVSWPIRLLAAVALLAVGSAVAWTIITTPDSPGLAEPVGAQLENIGVSNPVTAVLLDLRAYDTLLEVVVLFMALVAVWSLRAPSRSLAGPASAALRSVVSLLTPLMIIVGGYLLWKGAFAPGGAFQAGAVIASAGVLLLLSELPALRTRRMVALRTGVAAGVFVFAGIGLGCIAVGARFLEYPDGWSKTLILVIEAVSTVSIALVLVGVFAGNPHVLTSGYDEDRPVGES
ncbi:sodium:proton antiporter [Persicimonas caeni]|uniref:Sodium:proton antiporter n=1 Tax=Persicimonas caeni TaxID=2292766 RepID=A0A4Y6PZ35_PERCE|nr:hydrogen gas-evolving membrane-bound hydrogenase subunit E [Persicimonas caeni]QDG53005.1 sodium:proton antiporter [Persicimonas caeni]QED34227.1 sodium:proton antiporter [Persicimonas caeni]